MGRGERPNGSRGLFERGRLRGRGWWDWGNGENQFRPPFSFHLFIPSSVYPPNLESFVDTHIRKQVGKTGLHPPRDRYAARTLAGILLTGGVRGCKLTVP